MRDDSDRVRSGLQTMVGAFAAGVAIFLGVAWFLWHRDPPRETPETAPLITNVSVAMLAAALMARLVVRKLMTARENGWQQFIVVGAAMIEFGGLFGCVAYLLEGTTLAFCVGAIAVVLILALQFPTRRRWERWTKAPGRNLGDVPEHFEM